MERGRKPISFCARAPLFVLLPRPEEYTHTDYHTRTCALARVHDAHVRASTFEPWSLTRAVVSPSI